MKPEKIIAGSTIARRLVLLGSAWAKCCTYNPSRRVIIFSTSGTNQIDITTSIPPSGDNSGIPVASTLPPVILNFGEHGSLVCIEWYARSQAGNSLVIHELEFDCEGGGSQPTTLAGAIPV